MIVAEPAQATILLLSKRYSGAFYFTGLHTDYHTPGDDADKINYNGIVKIIDNINSVVGLLNESPKLAFTKTRETQTTTSARFSVSMGIMPDYTFAGTGVKADGVRMETGSKSRITGRRYYYSIGRLYYFSLKIICSRLVSLKGDKAKVKFKRGNEVLERTVAFNSNLKYKLFLWQTAATNRCWI